MNTNENWSLYWPEHGAAFGSCKWNGKVFKNKKPPTARRNGHPVSVAGVEIESAVISRVVNRANDNDRKPNLGRCAVYEHMSAKCPRQRKRSRRASESEATEAKGRLRICRRQTPFAKQVLEPLGYWNFMVLYPAIFSLQKFKLTDLRVDPAYPECRCGCFFMVAE